MTAYNEICDFGPESGCCLYCESAQDGCLCTNCKCKICDWYICPEDWDGYKGKCGLVLQRTKERNATNKKKYAGFNIWMDYTKPIGHKDKKDGQTKLL